MAETNNKKVLERYKFFRCSCVTEGILVEQDDSETFISLYSQYTHSLTFFDKLKEAFRIFKYVLKKGHPYTDCVILDSPTAYDLGQELISCSEKGIKYIQDLKKQTE